MRNSQSSVKTTKINNPVLAKEESDSQNQIKGSVIKVEDCVPIIKLPDFNTLLRGSMSFSRSMTGLSSTMEGKSSTQRSQDKSLPSFHALFPTEREGEYEQRPLQVECVPKSKEWVAESVLATPLYRRQLVSSTCSASSMSSSEGSMNFIRVPSVTQSEATLSDLDVEARYLATELIRNKSGSRAPMPSYLIDIFQREASGEFDKLRENEQIPIQIIVYPESGKEAQQKVDQLPVGGGFCFQLGELIKPVTNSPSRQLSENPTKAKIRYQLEQKMARKSQENGYSVFKRESCKKNRRGKAFKLTTVKLLLADKISSVIISRKENENTIAILNEE